MGRPAEAIRRELLDLVDEQEGMRPLVDELRSAATREDGAATGVAARWLALWRSSLEAHCRGEEARLVLWLPGSALLERLHREHGELRRLTLEVERAPSGELISAIAALMQTHLDWERDELLPAVAQAMGVSLDDLTP